MLGEEKIEEDAELKKVFGYSLFNNKYLSFEPSLNIPTPHIFQLGAGET